MNSVSYGNQVLGKTDEKNLQGSLETPHQPVDLSVSNASTNCLSNDPESSSKENKLTDQNQEPIDTTPKLRKFVQKNQLIMRYLFNIKKWRTQRYTGSNENSQGNQFSQNDSDEIGKSMIFTLVKFGRVLNTYNVTALYYLCM